MREANQTRELRIKQRADTLKYTIAEAKAQKKYWIHPYMLKHQTFIFEQRTMALMKYSYDNSDL